MSRYEYEKATFATSLVCKPLFYFVKNNLGGILGGGGGGGTLCC
jgi:hypothetical protein